jgi:hypothetical protein
VKRFAKPILMAAMALVLVAYASDCLAMSTPEEAMKCCDSMQCSSHGAAHGEDCCKTMTAIRASFVRPHGVKAASFAAVLAAMLPVAHESQDAGLSTAVVAPYSHAPPIPDAAISSPLRIKWQPMI